MIKKCVLLKEKKEKKKKTKQKIIGVILILAGIYGGYLYFQEEVGTMGLIISIIILIVGFALAGSGGSSSWMSSD